MRDNLETRVFKEGNYHSTVRENGSVYIEQSMTRTISNGDLHYWYNNDVKDTLLAQDFSTTGIFEPFTIVEHGIKLVYVEDYSANGLRLSSLSRKLINEAKDIYYKYSIIDKLILKNAEIVKKGKVNRLRIRRDRKKLIKRLI